MKKILSILMLVLTVSITFAEISVDSTTTVTQDLNTEMYETGKELLKNTVVGAGDVLSTGYDVIVAQQRVKAITYLVPLLFSIFLCWLAVRFYGQATEGQGNKLLPAIIFGLIAITCFSYGAYHFNDIVVGLVNPDYAAIKDMIEFGKDFQSAKTN